ncbi:MAG: thioredoxin domain-containing protein [Candidatus Paceibacterota bacterium]
MEKQNLAVPIAIVIAGILIAGAVFWNAKKQPVNNNADQIPPKDNQAISGPKEVSADDHILGNPDAQLAIVEFSDTECPYCKKFHQTMNQIMDDYGKTGKVKWIYRHFPLDALHDKARKEAEATECAADLGGNEKFWAYINRLYEITPSSNGLDLAELPKIAEYVGLDKKSFESCLSSGKFASKVEASYQDGISSGVEGTPYSVIINSKDGKKYPISGALPYQQVKIAIDQLLEAK